MSRCVAFCLVLGLMAVSGASAATRQAYSPSAQALVREVVSTLKVRFGDSPCPGSLMPSSAARLQCSLSGPLPPLKVKVSARQRVPRVPRLALSDASLLLSCPVRFRPMPSEAASLDALSADVSSLPCPSAQAEFQLHADFASWLQDWMAPKVNIHPSAYDAFAEEEEKFHLVVKCADLVSRWFLPPWSLSLTCIGIVSGIAW